MIEAKHIENKTGIFSLNNIQANQWSAYERCKICKNTNFILAIKWNNKVWFIDFGLLQFYKKSIDLKKIQPNFEIIENNKTQIIVDDLIKGDIPQKEYNELYEKFKKEKINENNG